MNKVPMFIMGEKEFSEEKIYYDDLFCKFFLLSIMSKITDIFFFPQQSTPHI